VTCRPPSGEIGLLPSRAWLGIYAKFALSFAKLPKMQTPNAKSLVTSFCNFWQITRMQSPNAKPLEAPLFYWYHTETIWNIVNIAIGVTPPRSTTHMLAVLSTVAV